VCSTVAPFPPFTGTSTCTPEGNTAREIPQIPGIGAPDCNTFQTSGTDEYSQGNREVPHIAESLKPGHHSESVIDISNQDPFVEFPQVTQSRILEFCYDGKFTQAETMSRVHSMIQELQSHDVTGTFEAVFPQFTEISAPVGNIIQECSQSADTSLLLITSMRRYPFVFVQRYNSYGLKVLLARSMQDFRRALNSVRPRFLVVKVIPKIKYSRVVLDVSEIGKSQCSIPS
jgi:hypothetical protein